MPLNVGDFNLLGDLKKKRVGGFDRSKLNPNFMANSKKAQDGGSGWAFDFANPDAGNTGGVIDSRMAGDEETLQRVIA